MALGEQKKKKTQTKKTGRYKEATAASIFT